METKAVLVDTVVHTGLITLNKPAKLNAWDKPMRDEIIAALRGFDTDGGVGAVVMLVLPKALEIGEELAAKAPLAMRIDRAWFAEMTEAAFKHTIEAAIRFHRESYGSGEPASKMKEFMAARGHQLG